MAVLTFDRFMLPVLRSLESSGPAVLNAVRSTVLDATQATNEERMLLTSGGELLLVDRIDWAVTYLFQAGLLQRPARATYEITELGRQVLRDPPESLTVRWLRDHSPQLRTWLGRSPKTGDEDPIEEVLITSRTPDETISIGLEELRKSVTSDLSEALSRLSPSQFEHLAVILLTKMGYASPRGAAEVTRPSGDGGIDGILYADPLGLQPLYMQAKWWESGTAIQRPEIDRFLGSLTRLGATAGVFVTTSTYSSGAKAAVTGLQTRIRLIDRDELLSLMFRFDAGSVSDRVFETKRFDPGFFETL